MGLMDVVGRMVSRRPPRSGNPLLDALVPMLLPGGALGGIGGLLGKFTNAGLGGKANSWVGTGANEPLEPEEVERVLGRDTIEQLSKQSGVPRAATNAGLATMIPNLVDQLSPKGSLPTGNLAKRLKGLDLAAIGRS